MFLSTSYYSCLQFLLSFSLLLLKTFTAIRERGMERESKIGPYNIYFLAQGRKYAIASKLNREKTIYELCRAIFSSLLSHRESFLVRRNVIMFKNCSLIGTDPKSPYCSCRCKLRFWLLFDNLRQTSSFFLLLRLLISSTEPFHDKSVVRKGNI